jgi:aspartate aminotransferase
MRISRKLQQLKPSATLAVSAKAMDLRAQGREIISLSVGEPDFRTPEHICQAAKQAIDEGFTRYTQAPGIPEARQAVVGYFKTRYGVDAPMDAAMLTNGGKQALYNAFQALLDPGDEVIVPAPYWVSYPAMIQLADGVPVPVTATVQNNFKVTVEDVAKALTSKTRCIIINSPSNPTGAHYTAAELDELVAFCLDKGLVVISDEIYDQLVYEPGVPYSLAGWWKKNPEQIVVVNGLAKSYAMTGWRVGYALAHPDLTKAMTKIQGQSTSNICSIAQKAAIAALNGPQDSVELMRATFARRRDLVMDIVRRWPDVPCNRPDGAFYVFPKVDAHYKADAPDSVSLCAKLLDKAGVALVPGAAFGDDACVRISYATSDELIIKGLDKVGKVLFG